MKIFVLIFGVLFISSIANGQDKEGYYGNKHYVSFETTFYSPMIYNARNNYDIYQNKLATKDHLNYGIHLSMAQIIKRNFAFVLELGMDFSSLYSENHISNYSMENHSSFSNSNYYQLTNYNNSNSYNSIDLSFNQENLDVRTFTIMPKIELANKKALLPLGLSHQIGLGFSNTKLIEKDYENDIPAQVYNYVYNSSTFQNEYVPVDNTITDGNTNQTELATTYYKKYMYDYKNAGKIINYSIMYAIYKKTPLTKNLMIQFGIKYTANLHPKYTYDLAEKASPYFYSDNDLKAMVYRQKLSNVMTFSVGLTYVFK